LDLGDEESNFYSFQVLRRETRGCKAPWGHGV